MSAPSSPQSSGEASPEPLDIDRCASLHNTIAALHLRSPYLDHRCQLHEDFWAVHTDSESLNVRQRLSADLNNYLAAISVFTISDEHDVTDKSLVHGDEPPQKKVRLDRKPFEPSFTPALHFPYPYLLFQYEEWPVEDERDDQVLESTVVLLYACIGSKGGLFFDMSTNLCCWASVEATSWPQRPFEWIPLESALERYLECWETGRYGISTRELDPTGCDFIMPYAQSILAATLKEWEALLRAIESRMPGVDEPSRDGEIIAESSLPVKGAHRCLLSREDIEDETLLQQLNLIPPSAEVDLADAGIEENLIPVFILQFLSHARKPDCVDFRIAPSVTVFDASSIRDSVAIDQQRRDAAFDKRGDMNDWFEKPILLFPFIRGDNGGKITEWKEWQCSGFDDLLVDRRAGLYHTPAALVGWFDAVKFVTKRPLDINEDDVEVNIPNLREERDVVVHDDVEVIAETSALHMTLHIKDDSSGFQGDDHVLEETDDSDSNHSLLQQYQPEQESASRRGNDVLFSHDNFFHCPYFGSHDVRLLDVLRSWRKLVENNVVGVGASGVEGEMEDVWEEARKSRIGLSEFDVGRCW